MSLAGCWACGVRGAPGVIGRVLGMWSEGRQERSRLRGALIPGAQAVIMHWGGGGGGGGAWGLRDTTMCVCVCLVTTASCQDLMHVTTASGCT